MKYILNEEHDPPFEDRRSIMDGLPAFFGDIAWVYNHGKDQKTHTHDFVCKIVLNSERVRMTIREIVKKEILDSALSESKILNIQEVRSKVIIDKMAARYSYTKMRMLGYIMHKALKRMYDKIVVNYSVLQKIKELTESSSGNVIYCPTHRSYLDFLILTYVLYAHAIKVPHICAGEDFLNISVINNFLSNSGAFYMKRSFKDEPLYKSIFSEYIQYLLGERHSIEFFLEGTRARGGKMLKPKLGLLNILTDSYFKSRVENLYFAPVTINYSRVLEGETFPFELLGEAKVKESLTRIVNTVRFISVNFGTIYLEFAKPISFKEYAQEIIVSEGLNPGYNYEDQKLITHRLAWDIIHTLSKNVLIMPIAICASILLMHRKGIREEELTQQVESLLGILKARNALMPAACNSAKVCVKKGTFHLNETVTKTKDTFELRVVPKVEYKNILLLSYYRNNLIHIFIYEALISCSMYGFGDNKSQVEGIDKDELYEKVFFISNLMRNEFIYDGNYKHYDGFNKMLQLMIDNKTLVEKEYGKIAIHPEGQNHINYLNSLIWPFIDTYWVTFTFIFSLIPSKFIRETEMFEKIQWFAESLYEDQIISFYESCSQEVIKNAVGIYHSDGIIVKQKLETIADGVKDPTIYTFGDKYNDEEKMQKFLDKLSHYRKPTLVKMSNMNNIRKSLLSDFPFMAKI
jgi:1-acyl-sn-glycerol-3-phosphate acyltransferase